MAACWKLTSYVLWKLCGGWLCTKHDLFKRFGPRLHLSTVVPGGRAKPFKIDMFANWIISYKITLIIKIIGLRSTNTSICLRPCSVAYVFSCLLHTWVWKMCYPFKSLVTTDKVHRKYSTILPCAAAINLFPFLKRRRLVGTYEWTF